MVEKLRPFINGNYVESKTDKYSDIYDPSTGHRAGANLYARGSRGSGKGGSSRVSGVVADPGAPPCGSDVQTP